MHVVCTYLKSQMGYSELYRTAVNAISPRTPVDWYFDLIIFLGE